MPDVHYDSPVPLKRLFEVFDSRFGVDVPLYLDTLGVPFTRAVRDTRVIGSVEPGFKIFLAVTLG
jgi:hypothetical protein